MTTIWPWTKTPHENFLRTPLQPTQTNVSTTNAVVDSSTQLRFCSTCRLNDLPKASAFNSTLFADDTVLSISSRNCTELQTFVNTELQKVDEWMRFNKLPLNDSKTSYMLIGPRGKRLHDFTVKINDGVLYPKQTPLNTWGCTLMINLLGQTTLPTLRKLPRAVLEFSIELDAILTKEHSNPCILTSSIVICNMELELGVASVRQAFDGWMYCTTK